MGYILLIALALLIFFGWGAVAGFATVLWIFAQVFLIGGFAINTFCNIKDGKIWEGICSLVATIFWLWLFGWIR